MPIGKIEVVYATSERQFVHLVSVEEGDSFRTVIEKSRVLEVFPELDVDSMSIGSYGKLKKLSDLVNLHDRVEIYRKVTADPRRRM